MATKREFDITGDIGNYSCSMEYVRYMLNQLGGGPITVKVTSPGGDVNHALKIKHLFEEHGDVTVEYIAFSASAATIIGHGAKKTCIHEDALYLIHKPEVWVNAWGYMNEDDLSEAIKNLQAQKKDAETVTLLLVQDYVNSRGIDVQTVMKLIKEARWIPGKDAVAMGLVDELIPSKNKKAVITNQMRACMSAAGLPIPEVEKEPEPESIGKIIRDELKKIFFSNFQIPTMDKQYLFVNQAIGVEGLDVKDGKLTLTAEQILALNDRLKTSNDAVTAATQAKDTAVAAQKTAENSLSDVLSKLDAIDPTVKAAADAAAKVTAIQTKLAERPGTKAESPQGKAGQTDLPKDNADWDVIDKLPHNRAIDEVDASFS
jgi:ATP-dependent protease ClpP protease subunit